LMFGGEGGKVGAIGATVNDLALGASAAVPKAAKASTLAFVDAETPASWLILLLVP
jgi:hypothetical protein